MSEKSEGEYRFLLIMERWGDEENHSYPLALCKSLTDGLKKSLYNCEMRAGKYEPFISIVNLDTEEISPMLKGIDLVKSVAGQLSVTSERS